MTEQLTISWPTCGEDGCIGIRLAAIPRCLAHASDEQQNAALKHLGETGEIDARGVSIAKALFEQILAAAPHDADDRLTFRASQFDAATFQGDVEFRRATFQDAGFSGATFQGLAHFDGATFQGGASFSEATFERDAWFSEATFQGGTWFDEATFQRDAWLLGATFQHDADFDGASFQGVAWFSLATFQRDALFSEAAFQGLARLDELTFERDAWFSEATFQSDVWFDKATFQGLARFDEATFERDADFDGATFQGLARFDKATFERDADFSVATFKADVWFDEATFHRDARFDDATFHQARQFGPLLAHRGLQLNDVKFAQPVWIEASTPGMCCRRARFAGGVQFRLRWARVVLDDSDLAAPSILAGIPRLTGDVLAEPEQRIATAWQRLLAEEITERPRLLSLQRANVAGLGLSSVELADCRFAGAHNLDRLRLEADVSFAAAPVWLRWDWRQVIAEERAWRAQHSRRWPSPRWPTWLGDEPVVLEAGQIAGLYRALRKGREDAKDEPGAADFYYGEMEMRRRARHRNGEASRGRVERAILTAYWLLSGYGLRAWRALAWLAAVTAGFAIAFHLVGFTRPLQPVSYWTSLLYAFRATLSLTDSEVQLTAWGKLLQALLRLTGPVLLALALLAIRARTKR